MEREMIKRFISLLKVQSHSKNEKRMLLYIIRQLDLMDVSYGIDKVGNIIVTKGELGNNKWYPCVVSHMDTVHNILEKKIIIYKSKKDGKVNLYACYENKNKYYYTGIGGDDKCGIFSCLELLRELPVLKVVFFTQEECGGLGSNGINLSFFNDVGYIIGIDRRGKSDLITEIGCRNVCSDEMLSEISKTSKEYGYKETSGLMTDVSELSKRNVGISCINMSCGYYKPHSNEEYITLNDWAHSYKLVKEFIKILGYRKFSHTPTYSYTYNNSDWYDDYDDYDSNYGKQFKNRKENNGMTASEFYNIVPWNILVERYGYGSFYSLSDAVIKYIIEDYKEYKEGMSGQQTLFKK